jgi:hypothetical protein
MWKPEHRLAAQHSGLRYPSDLTDAEWAIAEETEPLASQSMRHNDRSERPFMERNRAICCFRARGEAPLGGNAMNKLLIGFTVAGLLLTAPAIAQNNQTQGGQAPPIAGQNQSTSSSTPKPAPKANTNSGIAATPATAKKADRAAQTKQITAPTRRSARADRRHHRAHHPRHHRRHHHYEQWDMWDWGWHNDRSRHHKSHWCYDRRYHHRYWCW